MTSRPSGLTPEMTALAGILAALALAIDPTGDANRKTGSIIRNSLSFSEEAGIPQDVQALAGRMAELIEGAAP
jgi:hypothetical protein